MNLKGTKCMNPVLTWEKISSLSFFFFLIFKLYIIVLFLPNIKMNPPQVYMCSPSWTLLPPPTPFHPSGSSQCTSPKHPVLCIEPESPLYCKEIQPVHPKEDQSWIFVGRTDAEAETPILVAVFWHIYWKNYITNARVLSFFIMA